MVDVQKALAAVAEPTRLRILQLLAESPRTVGEIADALGALQPQTTKHLQALATAELIVIHRLGRRRVAALQHAPFEELGNWFSALAAAHPSEAALEVYSAAVVAEEQRPAGTTRTLHIHRSIAADLDVMWDAWTTVSMVRQWWAPEHFEVVDCAVDPVPGGAMDVSLSEPDGATYRSIGRFIDLDRPRTLRFEQSPLGADDAPMFTGYYSVSFVSGANSTELDVAIEVVNIRPGISEVVAGVEIGWGQTLDRLSALVENG